VDRVRRWPIEDLTISETGHAAKRIRPATLKLIFGVYFSHAAVKFVMAYFGLTNR